MSDDVVKTITIKGVADGIDPVTDSVNKLGDAMSNVSVVSDTTSKSTTSAQGAYDRLQRSLDTTYRSQVQYNNAQATIGQALNQGLVSQDRANQLMDLAQQKFDNATKSASPLTTAVKGVQTQMVALAAGLGPVGVLLASFGPVGLIAAAGIGLIDAAINQAIQEADRLGDLSSQIRNVSESAGLTTTQFQVLSIAGAGVGLTADQVGTSFEKFNSQLALLQTGSGNLLTTLDKFNPALALQLSSAQDSATAWNLLAQAYANADQKQQALIQRAIGGQRGGAAAGRLLTSTANAGGIGGLQSGINQNDLIDPQQLNDMATLTTQINQVKAATQNIWGSIFSEDVLQKQLQSLNYLKEMAEQAKILAEAGQGISWFDKAAQAISDAATLESGRIPDQQVITPQTQMNAARNRLGTRLGVSSLTGGTNTTSWSQGLFQPQSDNSNSFATQATQAKELVTVLGSAATITEQYNAKLLPLQAALADGAIKQDTFNRAVTGLQLDADNQLISARIGILGQLSSVDDIVRQKTDQIALSNQKGAGITKDQTAALIALAVAQKQYSDLQTQSGLGVANFSVADQAAKELAADVAAGIVPLDQQAVAAVALTKKYQDLHDAAQVAGSNLPQLTQLGLDAGNVNKQLDTFSTTSLNAVAPALEDMFNGTTTLSAGFQNLGLTVVKALENMLIQMTIIQPVALLLKNTLEGSGASAGLFGSLFGTSGGTMIQAETNAKGNVFDRGTIIHPYALGGILSDIVMKPTLFPMANGAGLMSEAGPEAIMPLRRGSDGRLGVSGAGGGGTIVNVSVNNNHPSANVGVSQNKNSSGGVDLVVAVEKIINNHSARGGLDPTMKGRYGLPLRAKSR